MSKRAFLAVALASALAAGAGEVVYPSTERDDEPQPQLRRLPAGQRPKTEKRQRARLARQKLDFSASEKCLARIAERLARKDA